MRFGQNAVKTPGRTHVNDCVTKGLKFRSSLFKGLQVQGGALVAPRRERNSFRIFPEGAFFFAYFLFERKKESKRLPPCNRVPRKYTPVGCFARTHPVTGPRGPAPSVHDI